MLYYDTDKSIIRLVNFVYLNLKYLVVIVSVGLLTFTVHEILNFSL